MALERMELDRHGPVPDRRFLVVDESGRFVTQRELPALAALRCALEPPSEREPGHGPEGDRPVGWRLQLRAPGLPAFELPLAGLAGPRREVLCWGDTCSAFDQGDEIAAWLSRHAERELRLVRLDEAERRPVDPRYAREPASTSFTDGFPLLVISEASLRDLNQRLGPDEAELPMDRFRPNLVVDGCEAYAEDSWRRVRVLAANGEPRLELDVVKPSRRCVVTTTNQQTLERGAEPLRTLARYRRASLGSSGTSGVYFGQNAVHRSPGSIEVGDRIEVIERGEPPFPPADSASRPDRSSGG